jgi:hypothetical protein
MAKNEHTSQKAGKAASSVLRDGRTGKDSKTAAGSALSQRPSTKAAHVTNAGAAKAVRTYLSEKKK